MQMETIMSNQSQKPTKPLDTTQETGAPNKLTEGGGVRQTEGGRNPEMQVQRSNRQGSGVPTQQRTEDR
jgi:hypothetical protein